MPTGRKRNPKTKSLIALRRRRCEAKKRKTNSTYIIVEDGQRDDDCVVVENTQENAQMNNNTFHLQDEAIYLRFNGDYFQFIDVPGDEDYFYHSVLEYSSLRGRFNCVQELKQYCKMQLNIYTTTITCYKVYSPMKEKMLHCGAQT